ncbi:MAG: hypothetical protein ACOZNI_14710 [Myxococcota bacterium]
MVDVTVTALGVAHSPFETCVKGVIEGLDFPAISRDREIQKFFTLL